MDESTLVIPDDLVRQLEACSEREGRPIVDILRDAIRCSVERQHPDRLRESLGTVSDSSLDVSNDEAHPSDQ